VKQYAAFEESSFDSGPNEVHEVHRVNKRHKFQAICGDKGAFPTVVQQARKPGFSLTSSGFV
jgi:hypothetical protein